MHNLLFCHSERSEESNNTSNRKEQDSSADASDIATQSLRTGGNKREIGSMRIGLRKMAFCSGKKAKVFCLKTVSALPSVIRAG